ncbi:hypothetical protein OV450_5606 [Actinobacteria bacterium OV450]|nr:hypothetical protein OV450_5606 [Actinobacteria bacterium OV450]
MTSFRPDRGTLRAAGFVALLAVVFLVTNTAVAWAADNNTAAGGQGLLAPLNVRTAEGGLLESYQLQADGGSSFNVIGQVEVLVMSGLFTLARLLVGLCCWLLAFVFRFPLLALLTGPAQHLADAYQRHVVDALGLKGLMLGWAFIFGLVLFVRGRVGTGLGEIGMTLFIAALAASAFIRPDYLLGRDGPLDQTHQVAIEVSSITASSYFGSKASSDPCDMIAGPAQRICETSDEATSAVTRPISDALTDALVVKPYMLLQYGRVLDPKDDVYRVHLDWIKSHEPKESPKDDPCSGLPGPAKEYCQSKHGLTSGPADFGKLVRELGKAGPEGKAAAAYAKEPTWDRVFAAVALLVAVIVVASMVVSMAVVMLGAQGADAAAAAAGPVVWVWAMLPGPPRTVLWRWVGVFVTSALVTFTTAMALPLFGIAVAALLSDRGPDLMVERLLLLDALAISFKVLHRRIAAAASTLGQRISMRLQYAKIGGSHAPSSAIAAGAYAGGLGRGGGRPLALGRAVGQARMAARDALAPVALAMRGAHAALIGPKPAGRHPAAEALAAVRAHPPRPQGEIQVDTRSGEILHDPATDRPLLGTRLHDRASRLRGYRIAHRVGHAAYGATLGLPRTVHNTRQKSSEFTQDARTQLRVTANRVREDAARWQPVGQAVYQGAARTGRAVRDTAIGTAIYAAPSTGARAPGPRTAVTRLDESVPAASRRSGTHPAVVTRTVTATTSSRSGSSGTARAAGAPGGGDGGAVAGPDQAVAERARLLALLNARRARGQGGSR